MLSDLAMLIIALLVGLSAWILGIRMQRRIRRALGRKAEDTDLTSLRTWMAVEEAEKKSGRVKPIQASDKNTISLQYAGYLGRPPMPIEYWIDIYILEASSVSETLGDFCGMFPEQSREYLISLITKRLTHLALINEIGFQLETREVRTNLSSEEALTRLKFSRTWDVSGEEELIVFFKTLSLRQKLSNLWNRIQGKPYTGRGSSVRRSW
jgi:hypothetical protein